MQVAGSTDNISVFSTSSSYRVGDVVYRIVNSKKVYYQCQENISADSWHSSNWLELKYYI